MNPGLHPRYVLGAVGGWAWMAWLIGPAFNGGPPAPEAPDQAESRALRTAPVGHLIPRLTPAVGHADPADAVTIIAEAVRPDGAGPVTGLLVIPSAVIFGLMSEVSRILSAIENGEPHAAKRLLPLVYDELRQLAAHKVSHEKPGQTLQPTALVHEAYLRLVASPAGKSEGDGRRWDGRGHFFSAAAEAMRRILIENARRKGRLKRGGDRRRVDLRSVAAVSSAQPEDLIAVDEALSQLHEEDAPKAELVKLRFFAGLTVEEAANCLGISRATADRWWAYARAWLFDHIRTDRDGPA